MDYWVWGSAGTIFTTTTACAWLLSHSFPTLLTSATSYSLMFSTYIFTTCATMRVKSRALSRAFRSSKFLSLITPEQSPLTSTAGSLVGMTLYTGTRAMKRKRIIGKTYKDKSTCFSLVRESSPCCTLKRWLWSGRLDMGYTHLHWTKKGTGH